MRKTRGGQQHRKNWGLATKFFVPGAFFVKFWVLSGSQVATQNDTRVWVPLGTDASVAAPDAHGLPLGALGLLLAISGVNSKVHRVRFT